MSILAATPVGSHYIQIPVAISNPECGDPAARTWERRLNRFVRFVAFGEWAGNAFGALAFLWATVVLLGGFCSSLKTNDFWFAAIIIFIEAFRIFSRNYTLDNQSLFGTTRALRWISWSFVRLLMRPQEGDEVVLIMGLCINVVNKLPLVGQDFLRSALLIPMSKWRLRGALQLTTSRQQRTRVLQLWAVLVAYLTVAAAHISINIYPMIKSGELKDLHVALVVANTLADIIAHVVAVLLLNLRPPRIANLTVRPGGRKLLSLAKVISAVWWAYNSVLLLLPSNLPLIFVHEFNKPFTMVVLSLGSLQTPATENSLFGHWVDAIMHILFLLDLFVPYYHCREPRQISFFLLAVLLVGNLQIPAAIAQIVISSLRLHGLLAHHDYHPLQQNQSQNLVPSIAVFYILALCQGAFYIVACILGFFSYFPCRSLLLRSGFTGQWGGKAIHLYYHRVYTARMETGVLAAGTTMTLDTFAMESLTSRSHQTQLVGVRILDSLLQESGTSELGLIPRVTSSSKAMSTLISMLGGTDVVQDDGGIMLFAARVLARTAGHLRIAEVPAGMVKSITSLLHAKKLSLTASGDGGNNAGRQRSDGQSAEGENGWHSVVWRCGHRMIEKLSVPEDPPLTQQDSFPVLGMVILERLAHDPDNCIEIIKARTLTSKIIGLIRYTIDNDNTIICSSLHLMRTLASTGGKIGPMVRQELWESPFLLDNLASIFEDSRSGPEVWTPAMDIIAKLALDEDARQEIGSNQMIIGKLVHAFLGGDEPDEQSLRMAAGEALVNLTMESTANCSAILETPRHELVKDLKAMLCEAEYKSYICLAAGILQSLCAHSRDKLMSHPGATDHLSSALPTVMQNIVSAEGKELETLIGLASQLCSIPECFVFELESQTNGPGLVKKLVATLNSNGKPSPEYPRMRRVIVEMVISFVTSYPGYRTMLRDEGMMEALSKAARTPSKVERHRVFSGGEGVVVETGKPLRDLVDMSKGLIGSATPATGAEPGQQA